MSTRNMNPFLQPSNKDFQAQTASPLNLTNHLRRKSCKLHTKLFREKNKGIAGAADITSASKPGKDNMGKDTAGNPSHEHQCKGPKWNASKQCSKTWKDNTSRELGCILEMKFNLISEEQLALSPYEPNEARNHLINFSSSWNGIW